MFMGWKKVCVRAWLTSTVLLLAAEQAGSSAGAAPLHLWLRRANFTGRRTFAEEQTDQQDSSSHSSANLQPFCIQRMAGSLGRFGPANGRFVARGLLSFMHYAGLG